MIYKHVTFISSMELLAIINFLGLIYLLYVVNGLKKSLKKGADFAEIPLKKTETAANDVPVYKGKETIAYTEEPDVFSRFFRWFSRDWPLKVGAFFILLGFIWLVTYAFLNNWIGPVGRIVLGIVSGSAILIWGSQWIKKNTYQGEILTTLGAGIVLISIFSAQYVYDSMFPPVAALMLSTLVGGMVAFVSYRNNTVRLAVLGYLIGAAAPLLTASKTPDVAGLFTYLFCLTAATIWLVRVTGWRILLVISLLTIWLYSLPWFSMYISPTDLIYIRFFAITFSIMFYFLSVSTFAYDKTAKPADAIAGALIGLYSLNWIMTIFPPEYRVFLCVIFAVGFMTGSYLIFHTQKYEYPVYLYTGVSIVFLIVATFIQFNGNVLAIVLATEAITLTIFADTTYGPRMVRWMSLLFILPILSGLIMLMDVTSLDNSGALIYINVTVYAAALYLMRYSKVNTAPVKTISKVFMVAAGVFSLLFLWNTMPYYFGYHKYYYQPGDFYNTGSFNPYEKVVAAQQSLQNTLFVAHAVTLTIFTIIGIFMYMYGLKEKHLWTKRFGLVLTCFVIARLLLAEIWSMSLGPRIITFFIIGIIFIASVFVRRSSHETQ